MKEKDEELFVHNVTPEQARQMSHKYINWREVCQHHIDVIVPDLCKLGERSAVLRIDDFINDATSEDLQRIKNALEHMGWDVVKFEQTNTRCIRVTISW